jgi:single-strand DNA-binding protein
MSKETLITVVGNVVKPPQKNRTATGSVTKFRVASTAQRFDKEAQRWVDKKPLFLDVECWGELGGNVSHTVSKGDPVVVHGELFTDEWETDQGRRSKTVIRAASVAPDLTWGTADFRRTARSSAPAQQEVADPGELGEDVPADPADEDYTGGVGALYVLDSDALPEPALH